VIPVLSVASINRPDLLRRMVASIDHAVGVLLVIDNSPDGCMEAAVDGAVPDCVDRLVVTWCPWNTGLAAAWNMALKAYPRAPWWMLANNDVAFGPGDLARLDDAMQDPSPHVGMLLEYAAFGLNRAVVDAAGFFDENLYPIYCEDSDHRWRTRLLGIPEVSVESGTVHVDGGSMSWRSDGSHALDNRKSYGRNVAYFTEKWGGPPLGERFTSPFDRGGWVGSWRMDLATLAQFRWGDVSEADISWHSPRTWETSALPPDPGEERT
jgi:GT2 family glycosyltransferase